LSIYKKYFSTANDAELEPTRQDLLQLILVTSSVLGGIALLAYGWVAYQGNGLADLVPHTVVYGTLLFLTINKNIPFRTRAFTAMFGVYALSVAEFRNNGLNGDGRILMLTMVALTSYLMGLRWGVTAFIVSLMTQIFLGIAIPLHWIPMPVLNELDVTTNVAAWQLSTLMFVILISVLVIGVYRIISHLAASLDRQRALTVQLNQERDTLQIRVDEQTADLRKEIAERARIEGDLRASEEQFRMLFESAVIPIILLRGFQFDLVNRAFLRLVGATSSNMLQGRSVLDFTAPEKREELREVFQSYLRGEDVPDVYETVGIRLDGSPFPCDLTATKLGLPGDPATLVYLTDITERKQAAERMQYLSTHDSLTDTYNRAYFEQILRGGLKAVVQPVSMLMMDVNGLKLVNDTWGHSAGDVLLRDAATILTRAMRGEDIIARIGGDEFVVIMPGTDQAASDKVIERIRHAIHQFNASHPDHHPISLAIGTATVDLNEAMMDVLKRADQAMYANKREQR